MYDVAVIGAGVIGTFIARELSRYDLNIVLIEKENDVACGITKANTAIIHSGYSPKNGTLKAKLNIKANPMFERLCEELDVPFKRVGSLRIAFDNEGVDKLHKKYKRGLKNKVDNLEILNKEQILKIEPKLNDEIIEGLYSPSEGIISPWEFAIALSENAVENGVELKLNSMVTNIIKDNEEYNIITENENIKAKYIINCAGLYADEIHNLVASPTFKITPKKGQYYVLDKCEGNLIKHVIFQCVPKPLKGVIVAPTIHGNILIGPLAEQVEDKTDLETTCDQLEIIKNSAKLSCNDINFNKTIRTFAALRPKAELIDGEDSFADFIIEESKEAKGFIDVAGIKSPGLSAAPAIAEYVINILKDTAGEMKLNSSFNPYRKKVIRFAELNNDEKATLINQNPKYGNVVCRCENITEGEIVDCIHRKVGATTVNGVKRRVRPGMGRCQGSFCEYKIMKILARELKKDISDIKKDSKESYILVKPKK